MKAKKIGVYWIITDKNDGLVSQQPLEPEIKAWNDKYKGSDPYLYIYYSPTACMWLDEMEYECGVIHTLNEISPVL